jgi:hypothetical protein
MRIWINKVLELQKKNYTFANTQEKIPYFAYLGCSEIRKVRKIWKI